MDMELSFEMNEEELEKTRKILTDGGLRHYILETFDNVKLDVVEFREYEKIEKENQKLKKQLENCYCNRTDCSSRIKDSKQYDSLVQKVENQQKAFMKLLENKIDTLTQGKETFADLDKGEAVVLMELAMVLEEYKEIIGGYNE